MDFSLTDINQSQDKICMSVFEFVSRIYYCVHLENKFHLCLKIFDMSFRICDDRLP